MQNTATQLKNFDNLRSVELKSFSVGHIVQINEKGRAVVDFPGNLVGPLQARSVIVAPTEFHKNMDKDTPVLLVFENQDPTLPIIIGIIHDRLFQTTASEEMTLPIKRPRDSIIDGKRLVLDAKEEITLRCGKSSVILRKDGKVVVKGIRLISRASETNKIKGASVKIN